MQMTNMSEMSINVLLLCLQGSELSEWQEEGNAWDTGEAAEDLTWQVQGFV